MSIGSDIVDLEAQGIRMEYYQRRTKSRLLAIEGLNLSVRKGEFVSLVGPSGCGKTTFLKIVDGLAEPTGGSILLRGRPISQSSRDRAMVFQDSSLFPWFTVARNVGYGLECQGVPAKAAAQRAQPYIDLVGLKGFEGHFPHELSGGMQQRANLARALVVDPAVLLMDEPFAALDAQTRETMQAELLEVWQQTEKTVLFVTHQINEAVYLSDRVVVLSARPGRVLDDIRIDIPRPRKLAVKRDDRFREYEERIWELIETQGRINMAGSEQANGRDATARPG